MDFAAGSRIGSYEIRSPLGAGGMGEVYRARDTKLDRDVALKFISDLAAGDAERVARFQREAQLLAALNHAHIASIYGFEEADGARFLVLELVEGETLAARLARGPLPLDEALEIARQIADALQAAHDKGIIHRDLKPANVAITPDEGVKVLDFGLAKVLEGDPSADVSNSPTLTLAATRAGVILGTAAYMSPEQARGRGADKRTDVWAFGCVLFEMLTGKRVFEGEDVTDIIAAVVRAEPDWNALPATVPPQIRLLIKRCLEKDRKQRIADISVARFLATETLPLAPAAGATAVPPAPASSRRRTPVAVALGVLTGALLAALGAWAVVRFSPQPAVQPMHFAIVPPPALPLAIQGADRDLALSPGGTHIAYVAHAADRRLLVRGIDQLEAQPLGPMTGVRAPFFSFDGRWVGYYANSELRKVSVTGGPSMLICRAVTPPRGATWGPDDTIVFALAGGDNGLYRVPAGGGEPKMLTKPDSSGDHVYPSFLPDGHTVVFAIVPTGGIDGAQIAALDLATGKQTPLLRGGANPQYVKTGHLVYAVAGSLRAVRFDASTLQVSSDPVPVVEQVMTSNSGAANFAVSDHGTLVYVPGSASAGVQRTLVWVDRKGIETPIEAPPRAYVAARIAPDGTRIALDVRDQDQDVWLFDIARKTLTRLTFGAYPDQSPVWSADGRRIMFNSARDGNLNLYSQAADNTGSAVRLGTSQNVQVPHATLPDGSLVYMELMPQTGPDIWLKPPNSDARPQGLIQTIFSESNAFPSPDGKWIAYQSNESGQPNIFVRPFPKVQDGRWQISSSGGSRPLWSHDGKELFYLDGTGAISSVTITTTPVFSAGNPAKLFESRYYASLPGRAFDVGADGRFVMVKEAAAQTATPASMVVVVNWFEELKQRVGVK